MYRIVDRICFTVGLIIIGPVIILGLLLNGGYFDFIHQVNLCTFNKITGLYCPGCGITRSCFALFSGHVLMSLFYHVIPVCAVLIFLIYMTHMIRIRILLKKRGLKISQPYPEDIEALSVRFHKRLEIAIYIIIGLAITQWLIKDILLICLGIDYFQIFNF